MALDMKQTIRTSLMTPGTHGWGVPLLFVGMPGVAKTAIGCSEAADLGMHPYVLIGSQIEAPDIGGFPAPGERYGKRCLDPLAPYWAIEMNHICETTDAGCVLILDELNTCPPPVQAAMLRVVNERMAGGVKLHERIRILAFMNPPEIAAEAGGNPIAPAMANRVGFVDWVAPTIEDWSTHLMDVSSGQKTTTRINTRLLEEEIMRRWHEFFVRASGECTAFLLANSKRANAMPTNAEERHGPWASYRSWENATRFLAGSRLQGASKGDQEVLVGGFVSAAIGKEFFHYLRSRDIPDAGEWMAGKVELSLSSTRLDVAATVLRTAVALLTSTADDDQFIKRLVFLIQWFIDHSETQSSLIANPMRNVFMVWRKRCSGSAELTKKLLNKHGKTVTTFRQLPMLAQLEDLGILNPGTAAR